MKIALLGSGVLTEHLADLWSKQGHSITAATSKTKRLKALSRVTQKEILLQWEDRAALSLLLADCPTLVITSVVDSPEVEPAAYLAMAHALHQLASKRASVGPHRLIYLSSTLVYGDHRGLWVNELSSPKNRSEEGKTLIGIEKAFFSFQELGWSVAVLRMAEVYHSYKDVAAYLRIRRERGLIETKDSYTNMIHRHDAIAAIDYILKHKLEGIYNLADDDHTTVHELYDQVSPHSKLPKVRWDNPFPPVHILNKRVSNHKIKAAGFAFQYSKRVFE